MDTKQKLEKARVLYCQSLELSCQLFELAHKYHLKDERYERVQRLYYKAEARVDFRLDRLLALHEAFMFELDREIISIKDFSSTDSTGLALSPAQPVDAVGQGATSCDPAFHHPDVSCSQCGFGKHSVLEIGCGAGAIVSDRELGYSGDEALDEAEPVTVYFQHADVSCSQCETGNESEAKL